MIVTVVLGLGRPVPGTVLSAQLLNGLALASDYLDFNLEVITCLLRVLGQMTPLPQFSHV